MGLPLDFLLGSTDLVLRVVVKLMLVDLVFIDLIVVDVDLVFANPVPST